MGHKHLYLSGYRCYPQWAINTGIPQWLQVLSPVAPMHLYPCGYRCYPQWLPCTVYPSGYRCYPQWAINTCTLVATGAIPSGSRAPIPLWLQVLSPVAPVHCIPQWLQVLSPMGHKHLYLSGYRCYPQWAINTCTLVATGAIPSGTLHPCVWRCYPQWQCSQGVVDSSVKC